MNGPDGDPGHCISNAEYFIETTAMRLPPDPNAPLRHKFRGPAFDSHIKCWRRRRFRLLDRSFFYGRWFWALFFQDHVDQAQHISLRRCRCSGSLRIMLAREGERLLEITDIEPGLGADAFQQAVFPQPGDLDIEFAFQLSASDRPPACRSR
jgi:hypothetical protein